MKTINDYLKAYKSLKQRRGNKNINIALLASFTSKGIKEVLTVQCNEIGITADIYEAEYNQYNQEIIDEQSNLYKHTPNVIFLMVDTRTMLGDSYFNFYDLNATKQESFVQNKLQELTSLIELLIQRTSARIIVHNFEVPTYSPLGILENKEHAGFIRSIRLLNDSLAMTYRNDSQTFIFDYDAFTSYIGKQHATDWKMYYLGDFKLAPNHIPGLCKQYIPYLRAMTGLMKKCLVLDLDNTVWGGIIGEDGIKDIHLGPTQEGRPFWELQKYILSLFKRGIILAINSSNNYEDAIRVIRENPYMILKEEHFASIQINWNDKISNMKAIAKEINIGLDSLAFFDDDHLNREMIRQALPQVHVIDAPDDPALYLHTAMQLDDFNTLHITEEDKKKGSMYAQNRKRQHLAQTTTDITTYLKQLEMSITIEQANNFNTPRISQLTQRTNQFNMTTKRYLEEDIKSFATNKNYIVFCIKVLDKFGDNGITGVAIIKKANSAWTIDTLLLSCRVIGRRIEDMILAYIIEEARKAQTPKITAQFIPTNKNAPAKDFYKNCGFTLITEKGGKQTWEYPVDKTFPHPTFITVRGG